MGRTCGLGATALKYGKRRDLLEVAAEDHLSHDIHRAVEHAWALLPNPIEIGPVRAAWYFAPCARPGGDIFGYQFLDDTCFTGFLLDVSGHGIGSALHASKLSAARCAAARCRVPTCATPLRSPAR